MSAFDTHDLVCALLEVYEDGQHDAIHLPAYQLACSPVIVPEQLGALKRNREEYEVGQWVRDGEGGCDGKYLKNDRKIKDKDIKNRKKRSKRGEDRNLQDSIPRPKLSRGQRKRRAAAARKAEAERCNQDTVMNEVAVVKEERKYKKVKVNRPISQSGICRRY